MSANSSGVRNLRAMFENKTSDLATSTSPPSRGRSPAESDASLPSRPVSKVRASFVAVERPAEAGQGQQWGLRKASDVGAMADVNKAQVDGRAASQAAQDAEAGDPITRSSADEQANGTGEAVAAERAEAATHQPPAEDGGLGVILKGSAFESLPSETANAGAVTRNGGSTKPKPVAKPTSTSQSASLATRVKEVRKDPPPKGTFIANKNAISVLPPEGRVRPLVSTKSPTTPKSPPQKTPTSPNVQKKVSSPKSVSTGEPGKTTSKPVIRSPALPKPERKSAATTAASKVTQPIKTKASDAVPPSNGVKKDSTPTSPKSKPRPWSPTRPARLPAAATAPTAASVAKASSVSDRPASRADTAAAPNARNAVIPQSNRLAAKLPTSTTAATLAKKTSRASLASQPGGHEVPKSRTSNVAKAPDDGFLARMTRPTASFAQKTHEKLQVHSPPRERTSTTRQRPRKSAAKLEDDHQNTADPSQGEDGAVQGSVSDSNGVVDGATLQAEGSAPPLAAEPEAGTTAQETH